MIEIKKGEKLACCDSCYSDDKDIVSVYFRKAGAGGVMIELCNKCRKDLIKTLQEVDE